MVCWGYFRVWTPYRSIPGLTGRAIVDRLRIAFASLSFKVPSLCPTSRMLRGCCRLLACLRSVSNRRSCSFRAARRMQELGKWCAGLGSKLYTLNMITGWVSSQWVLSVRQLRARYYCTECPDVFSLRPDSLSTCTELQSISLSVDSPLTHIGMNETGMPWLQCVHMLGSLPRRVKRVRFETRIDQVHGHITEVLPAAFKWAEVEKALVNCPLEEVDIVLRVYAGQGEDWHEVVRAAIREKFSPRFRALARILFTA